MRSAFAFLAVLLFALAPARAEDAKPVVFAAASLKGSLDEAAAAFKAAKGIDVNISYAGSNALAQQIANGAPAELFISADEKWMDDVAGKGFIKADSRVDLLSNELVLIAPKASAVQLKIAPGFGLAAALGDGKLAMADPDSVPAGIYGKAALTKLGVWDAVSAKVARAENVRAALAFVAAGEAALGIVYLTDASAEAKVRLVDTFPADTHELILYPAALTSTATDKAAQFLAFLQSDAATAIFTKAGFGKPAKR